MPHFADDHNAAFYTLGGSRAGELIQLKLWGECAEKGEEIVRAVCAVLRARGLAEVERITRHTYLSRDITKIDDDEQPHLQKQVRDHLS